MTQFNLTPAQTRFVFLFNGLAPVATSIATPMVTYAQLRRKQLPPQERKLLLIQEIARQVVSCTIGLVSYFGGAFLTGRLMRRSASKSLGQIIGGTVISFLGYGFVRPLISTELLVRWMQKQAKLQPPTPTHTPPSPVESRMVDFWQGVESRATFRGGNGLLA